MLDQFKNLNDLLRRRAENSPEKVAFTFLKDGELSEINWTYQDLDQRARAIAAELQSVGKAGERALLLYPPGLGFVAAFLGCLYAEIIAVPAYPPRLNRNLLRLQTIVKDCDATFVLTTRQTFQRMQPLIKDESQFQALQWMVTDDLPLESAGAWNHINVAGDATAFLQYTSGSTGSPKGVVVSHRNLLHNQAAIQNAFGQSESSVIVGWLPLYHDMGLIGNMLQPLYTGARCILMAPTAFLQRPFRWLNAISRYHATTSGGPNFSYDLCVNKITSQEESELDLSSWTEAFNGAEPVRADTMERFAARFGRVGFRSKAFSPCYGLAESTLLVTAHAGETLPLTLDLDAGELAQHRVAVADNADNTKRIVSCGKEAALTGVKIVDPESLTACAPERVGEIWISGPSIAQGYWNNSSESQRVFRARMADSDAGPFLRTGDLGFIRNGELFVTGRSKDLIILRGRNYYPQDIEATAERAHASLRPGCGAAFGVDAEEQEQLVVVQEIEHRQEEKAREAVDAIFTALAEQHEVQPYAVVLIRFGSLPKTSSGKIQHYACRDKFLSGNLNVVFEWRADGGRGQSSPPASLAEIPATATELEQWLVNQIAAAAGVSASLIQPEQSMTRYAVDSLAAVALVHTIERELGVAVSLPGILGKSVHEFAEELWSCSRLLSKVKSPAEARKVSNGKDAGEFPLSENQRSLWFLYQLAPESAAYNLAFAARIRNEVNAEVLKNAFQTLLNRHPSLRTTFHSVDGEPFQRVQDFHEVSFEEIDAAAWDETKLKQVFEREAASHFNLESGSLLRVVLFRHSPGQYSISLAAHHIVADLWSLALLMHELTLIYTSEITGRELNLPPPSGRYQDYVFEQRQMLASDEGSRLLSYWKHQLGGELPALDLPADRPRPAVQTFHGASRYFDLGAEMRHAIRKLSQKSGTTIYMTLLAAFQVLLGRYSGQQDILVGSPIAGRVRPQWVDVFGYFVNPVVMRARLFANPAFAQFLSDVRATVLQALEHQGYPFTKLVEYLQPQRDSSRSPMFQAMFTFEKTLFGEEQGISAFAAGEAGRCIVVNGLTFESLRSERQTALFDLMLSMADAGDTLCGSFQYNTDLFEAQTIERFVQHWEQLLRGIIARPETPIQELPLLNSAEREQLLVQWNRTDQPWAWDGGVQRLFAKQARRIPNATAVSSHTQWLSYGQLDERSNQLARYLRNLGVGAEVRVGICMERSVEMVVALLGVMKAGGAYVPMDPTYPAERLSYMLRDAETPVLLTQRSLAAQLPACEGVVIRMDDNQGEISRESCESLDSGIGPENLAYVIYTSGSTGTPKGVAIRHSSVAVMVRWAQTVFSANELAGVLACTSICFDLSVFEIFVPLVCGGTVLLAGNALELASMEGRERVTLVNTVPSAIRELVQSNGIPESVGTVNLAGEALGAGLVRQIYDHQHIHRVLNLYGPSEDTTYSTYTWLKDRRQREEVSIGKPIANTQVYVLDEGMKAVPVGVAGELYIGGAGLARGYLNRPELTAEKFVPNPFQGGGNGAGGERLYRTGDRVRYRADGNLEFLGRLDHQVKVRGFRIELGEIETALSECEGVEQAVVVAREDRPGEKFLAAYVVSKSQEQSLSMQELREHLRQRLPEYMVPMAIVQLERMPLTSNGKIDRKKLPVSVIERDTKYNAPRTPVEEMIRDIWSSLLAGDAPGRDDNFFKLGGHSLLASQVVARLRSSFGIELPLRAMFEAPTLAALARKVEIVRGNRIPPLRAIERRAQEKLPPLSYSQRRLWFLDQLAPGSCVYNLPGAVRIHGTLDVQALEKSLAEIVRRHESLRTRFVVVDGEPWQMVESKASVSFQMQDLSMLPVDMREAAERVACQEEAQTPFSLELGPLLRVKLLRRGHDDYLLLLTIHHIVSDGWSLGILISELALLYEAFSEGRPSPLPELAIQYADYAIWQQQWLNSGALDRETAYWKEQLAGLSPLLNLPADHPRQLAGANRGATAAFTISSSVIKKLKDLSQHQGATLYMTLLAAFQTFLYRHCGQQDFAVGSPIAGRIHTETEAIIGLFVNTLVLRADLSGEPAFTEVLRRVRQATLDAYANQHVPLATLVEILHPDRNLGRNPLFQVTFDLQSAPLPGLRLGSAELRPFRVENGTTKFDLSMTLQETGEDISGELEYDTSLFDVTTIERMIERFKILIEGIGSRTEQSICNLPLLAEAEWQQLVFHWNSTSTDYPCNYPLIRLIEEQVERTPAAVAVAHAGRVLNYNDLNERANQLARYLAGAGVGPEVRVGICMGRSPEILVALLGTLKAGAAYVPLDPDLPVERLHYMVRNAGVRVLLTEQANSLHWVENRSVIMNLDEHWHHISRESSRNLSIVCPQEQLAYLIYTSGSMGKPKAVAITHGGLLNLIHWHNECYQLSAQDRMTQFAALSFDAAVWEIWPALVAGAQLHIVDDEVRWDSERLPDWLLQKQITVAYLPTPVAETVLSLEWPKETTLRFLLTGGDKLQQFPRPFSSFVLRNHYGPTENTVVATACLVTNTSDNGETSPPIGQPISNTRVYVVDKHRELSPLGATGELYLGGSGLARGYLNDPELTAEKFVPDPYSSRAGERLYRTGDQVRWRADGKLEFLGRIDHQVKIRGYRIELGDIEAALAEHPGVRQLVVTVWEPRPGDRQLAAYVVSNGKVVSADELRLHLKTRLPEYMVPSAVVMLEQFPLTSNGKIDRKALPPPEISEQRYYVAPRTPTEVALCKIWSDVLKVESIGIEDDLFELGGHSLLATRIISQIRTQMEIDLPLLSLFRATRISELSPLVDQAISTRTSRKPRLTRIDRDSYLSKSR